MLASGSLLFFSGIIDGEHGCAILCCRITDGIRTLVKSLWWVGRSVVIFTTPLMARSHKLANSPTMTAISLTGRSKWLVIGWWLLRFYWRIALIGWCLSNDSRDRGNTSFGLVGWLSCSANQDVTVSQTSRLNHLACWFFINLTVMPDQYLVKRLNLTKFSFISFIQIL